jgi:hypothetical protein
MTDFNLRPMIPDDPIEVYALWQLMPDIGLNDSDERNGVIRAASFRPRINAYSRRLQNPVQLIRTI